MIDNTPSTTSTKSGDQNAMSTDSEGTDSSVADSASSDAVSPYPVHVGQPTVPDGTQAVAGSPLAEDDEKADMADIISALKTVHDPEIPVNIHDLGLIYSCDIDESGDVDIFMTLTAPACPVAGQMPQEVATTVAAVDGVGTVTVTLTWQPPWNQERMSDDARLALGFF